MKPSVRPPRLVLSHSRAELLSVALLGAVVAIWAASAQGSFSFALLLACEAVFFSLYLLGSLVAGCRALALGIACDLPLRLVFGYGVLNTTLLVLAWLSPLGIVANFAAVLALALLVAARAERRREVRGASVSLLALGLCVVATTLWCQDSIRPTADRGELMLYKPWVDGFYHAVHVRIFGAAHGASTIEDFRLAGVPARPYHYGMYLLPALLKQLAGLSAYAAFAGILAPLGVLLSGLSAYGFFSSLWGRWSGLGACAALFLLPDGAQQGMRNPFMSYHFLTQISPSATHGVALLALGWLLVLRGCRRGSALQLAAGWLLALVVGLYKLHFLIGSAFLLLLVPVLFFRARLSRGARALAASLALIAYFGALHLVQKVPGVPLIRFDGSAVGEILRLILSFGKPGAVTDWAARHMGAKLTWTQNLTFGPPYVLGAMLGLMLPLLLALPWLLRGRSSLLLRLFPFLLLGNFLLMFFGLALDFDSSTPDELSHRPLIIVYFFVVGWIGGAVGLLLRSVPRRELVRGVGIAACAVLLAVPAHFGAGVQLLWAMPRISPVRLSKSMLRVAQYIHDHGNRNDLIQDSQFDSTYVFAALSERRTFVSHTLTRMPFRQETVEQRTSAIEHLMAIRKPKLVRATAHALGLRWFVLEYGDHVEWPPEIADHPVLEDGPLKLYEF